MNDQSKLLEKVYQAKSAGFIDLGGGASTLVDDLLADSFRGITRLDLSQSTLEVARSRIGAKSALASCIPGDICSGDPTEQAYGIWHDISVFHFLIDSCDCEAYVRQVMRSVKPGGHVIVATFATDGPEQFSGLPVARYDPDKLRREFGPAFDLVERAIDEHTTPWDSIQHFVYCH
jgi:SAM-dependent methyltransferase